MRGPDFFIVGAPKCGTTAMADYLAQHPEIGMCDRKESHYLVGDLASRMRTKRGQRSPTREEYLAMFSSVQDRRRLGEASVWYLYSETASREIERFCLEAQILIMLRNPIELLPSLHSQFVFMEIEPEGSFERALALDGERERSGTPAGFPPHSYRAAVRFAEQIRRYLRVFGRERVHVVVYDDFRADTLAAYRETCQFLGVDATFEPTIEVVNANRSTKSRTLQRLVRRPPEPLRRALHAVSGQEARRLIVRRVMRWNARHRAREPVSDEVAHALAPEVVRQVDELRQLLGLDLSDWLRRVPRTSEAGGGANPTPTGSTRAGGLP